LAEIVADDESVDKEKLATLVSQYEYMYKKDHRQYRNKIRSTAAWAEIAQRMGITGI